ncbi:MAG: MCE family protein [Candidatus Latescibacteria bacterium]|nr:MCE family protein [Candidatus Latescibacterota bacterium]
MQYQRSEIRAGLVIVAAMIALFGMVFFAGNLGDLFKTRKSLNVQFPRGGSREVINPGADVRFAGAPIGTIEQVDVHGDQVEIRITVDADVAIKTNSRATIKSVGLLGGAKYLDISAGSPQAPLVKPGDILIGEEGMAMEELLATVAQITKNVQHITASVDTLLSSGERPGEVVVTLKKTQRLLDGVNTVMTSVNHTLSDDDRSVRAVLDQVNTLTKQVNSLLHDNRGTIDTTFANVNAMTAQLPQVLTELRKVLVGVQAINDRVANGNGTVGQLMRDDVLHLRVQRMIESTDSLLQHIRTKGVKVRLF